MRAIQTLALASALPVCLVMFSSGQVDDLVRIAPHRVAFSFTYSTETAPLFSGLAHPTIAERRGASVIVDRCSGLNPLHLP